MQRSGRQMAHEGGIQGSWGGLLDPPYFCLGSQEQTLSCPMVLFSFGHSNGPFLPPCGFRSWCEVPMGDIGVGWRVLSKLGAPCVRSQALPSLPA